MGLPEFTIGLLVVKPFTSPVPQDDRSASAFLPANERMAFLSASPINDYPLCACTTTRGPLSGTRKNPRRLILA